MSPAPPEYTFSDAIVTEAVRWAEQNGPLDDAAALRRALAGPGTPLSRIHARARVLGERLGLQATLARARAWAPWVLLGLAAAVVLAGLGLANSVVGEPARRINVMAALASLLGLHLLTLLVWLAGVLVAPGSARLSLGGLWLALTARVAGGRQGQAPLLLRAATGLLERARLLPWALGLVSHAIWTLSFAVALGALLFALAFRSYTLAWETTILDPEFFVRGVQLLGRAPAWLGFPVPDAQMVRAATADAAGQRAWALWLTGCLAVYGLLPRALLALLCLAVLRRRRGALQAEVSAPYYRLLLARFDALAPTRIVDADAGLPLPAVPPGLAAENSADALLVLGFELPPEWPWPPAGLPAAAPALRVDGSAAQRSALLDRLAALRPRRVLLVCNATASPDRGTARFLREVLALCTEGRLWLAAPPGGPAADEDAPARRWQTWLHDSGFGALVSTARLDEALRGWA
ncbi:DUF2868 domain-containing protein [Xylophilus sp. ASV27]|uniref:DUF2868 domain-containing protein n=1 Tax=Xylophilus sp. ASV27 TaxID=2795129 RepID=UPI0018EAB70E|nr:DUF2868 domain-containing protein [Xylophilus sp. ASV27]